jgi:hypothetical protein
MGKEDRSRFSYITVGGAVADDNPQPETTEEEVMSIGAVDVEAVPTQAVDDSAPAPAVAPTAAPVDQQVSAATSVPRPSEPTLEDSGLDAPMPAAQKLVVAVCLVGFVVTIAFLVWYWLF